MSITFGIYDFFSYTVPGFLYLFALNQLLALLQFPHLSFDKINLDIGFAFIGVVIAYVIGGLLDSFAYQWYLLFYKNRIEKQALENMKKNYPDLKIGFEIKDRRILFSFIRHNHLELAENIDKFKALSIMFHNISLGLFIYSLVEIAKSIVHGISITSVIIIILALVFSFVAIRRSALFNFWYWSGNFEQALHYGKNVSEMFGQHDQKTLDLEPKTKG